MYTILKAFLTLFVYHYISPCQILKAFIHADYKNYRYTDVYHPKFQKGIRLYTCWCGLHPHDKFKIVITKDGKGTKDGKETKDGKGTKNEEETKNEKKTKRGNKRRKGKKHS